MEKSPTKSPQKKMLRVSSDISIQSELAPEYEIIEDEPSQVSQRKFNI
jgi:hypothetical protein